MRKIIPTIVGIMLLTVGFSSNVASANREKATTITQTPAPTMQGNPTTPIPDWMAKQGGYQLHNGDPLPDGVLWADPNVVFSPPNAPRISRGDPPVVKTTASLPDWTQFPCFDTGDDFDGFYQTGIWADGARSTIKTENPWGWCSGQNSDTTNWTMITWHINGVEGFAQSGSSWGTNGPSAAPFWAFFPADGGPYKQGWYPFAVNAGDTYDFWVTTIPVGANGCPPGANYNHCLQFGFGYVPYMTTGIDLLDGIHTAFGSSNYDETQFAETAVQGGASNPSIKGNNLVQNPGSNAWVGLPTWAMNKSHPDAWYIDALNTYGIVELWNN